MSISNFLRKFIRYLAPVVLISLNGLFWGIISLNWLLFAFFILCLTADIRTMLVQIFQLSRAFRIVLLSLFVALMIVAGGVGVTAVFIGLTIPSLFLTLAFISFIFSVNTLDDKNIEVIVPLTEFTDPDKDVLNQMPTPWLGVVLVLFLMGFGFYLLVNSRGEGNVLSPWSVIDPYYLWVVLLMTFALGVLIFSNLKAKTILFLLFLHSLLLHSYLALTHALLYGADSWRHLAVELSLTRGFPLSHIVLSDTIVRGLDWGQLAYAQFWGLALILNRFFGFGWIAMQAWILPVGWSAIGTILLFEIGRALGWEKKWCLLLAWLSGVPFVLQVVGAFTLPANLGLLWFLFIILILLKRLQMPVPGQRLILILLFIVSCAGYSLFPPLIALAWLLVELNLFGRKIMAAVVAVVSIVLIPALEKFAGFASAQTVDWWSAVKQIMGNFSGWYLVTGPRSHDILTGNIILNQTPTMAFVPNMLLAWPWWLLVGTIGIFILALVGYVSAWRVGSIGERVLSALAPSVLGGYIISRYFLAGEQVLSRRLDGLIAIFILLFLVIGVNYLVNKYFVNAKIKDWALLLLLLFISVFSVASYSLGPDTATVSLDEFKAMNYVWQKEKGNSRFCVVADTYPLLALEAISARRIVGGGFPINEYFAQPERMNFYNNLLNNYTDELWINARLLTKAPTCYLVAQRANVTSLSDFTHNVKIFGQVMVWQNL
ncbi:MAG: hypothetical protein Q7S66_02995 [bacterium]|nr:hypothetical protein [bacterium]